MPRSAKRAVELESGVVESQFDDREIGGRGLQELRESRALQVEFGLLQIVKGAAEVHQHEIGFMAHDGVQRAAIALGGFQNGHGFGENLGATGLGQRPPGGSAETQHLVEHAPAFRGQGNGGQFGGVDLGMSAHRLCPR